MSQGLDDRGVISLVDGWAKSADADTTFLQTVLQLPLLRDRAREGARHPE